MTPIVKSFSKERLKENLGIFDWGLPDDDLRKIGQIPQKKIVRAETVLFSTEGEFTSADLADMEVVEECLLRRVTSTTVAYINSGDK